MRFSRAGSLSLLLALSPLTIPAASAGLPVCICEGTGSLEQVINDHLLPHEERPFGIPDSWDWSTTPVTHSGTNPGEFLAMTFWASRYTHLSGAKVRASRRWRNSLIWQATAAI